MASDKNLAVAAGLCSGCGLAAWSFYIRALASVLGEDWMVYYTAIRTYFENNLGLLYDGDKLTALLNARLAEWHVHPLPLHPWLYPPHYLLLLLPFGELPPILSGALFLLLGFAGMVAASLAFCPQFKGRMICALSFLLCPATAITTCLGQNTFFTCALLLGGFGLIGRWPLLGGILLGTATYKPQLWLMVPVALIAERQWRALAAAAATAMLLVLASAAVFGVEPWRAWFDVMVLPSALFSQWNMIARLNGQSIYTYAVLSGAPPLVANVLQAASALIAASAVWWCYRRPIPTEVKLAVLLAATMLAASHVIDYDALMLGIAATLIFVRSLDDGLHAGETLLLMLVWVSPFINPPSVFPIAFATPFLILAFIAWVMSREHRQTHFRAGSPAPEVQPGLIVPAIFGPRCRRSAADTPE